MPANPEPLDRLDQLMLDIAADQAAILKIVADSMADHQAVDEKYAPQLNPLYRSAWSKFREAERIAEAHKTELMARDRKSSRRNTGTIGWRSHSRLILHVPEDEIIQRIRSLGIAVSRMLLRRKITWELRVNNIKSVDNEKIVADIDGLEVSREDVCYIDPNNGIYMSVANPWWPTLEGITGTRAFRTLFKDPDE